MRASGLLLASLAAVTSPMAAAAQTRQPATVLMSDHDGVRRFQEQYGFSDAVIAGDTIYLSGVVVGLPDGDSDLEGAFERTYQTIRSILSRVGASWDDVVDITSYHTDLPAQFEAMAAVHRRHVRAPFPAWTAIDVDRLVPDRGIAEIKIVARRPAAAAGN